MLFGMLHDDWKLNRRRWITESVAAPVAGLLTVASAPPLKAVDYDKPVPGSEKLTAYQNGGQILVRWNNRVLCGYRSHSDQKYPYLYPLAGPVSGVCLTAESALPYPHHRGLWLGCQPLNGGDYWGDGALEQGQIRSAGAKLGPVSPSSAVLTDRCEWVRKDAPSPLEDTRKFTVTVLSERVWLLDAEFHLTAREDITIKQAKHSFFALRAAADVSPIYGGKLVNSEGGAGADGTYGKTARWCGFYGRRRAPGRPVEGIIVMDHPSNPWAPCPWLTRDYGHLSPSPFNFQKKPWTLAKGRSLDLKYRIVLHADDPRKANVDGIYKRWIAG